MKHRATAALPADDRICNFLLLDCFVLLQRNRKRAAVDRPGAIAPKCETSRTGGRPVIFGGLTLALGALVLWLDQDYLRTGAAVMTCVVSAVLAVMATTPAVRFVHAARE